MASIEIKTVQNVRISYELGTFWERLIATAIDWFAMGMFFLALFLVFPSIWYGDSGIFSNLIIVFLILTFVFYSPVSEYFLQGASLGKRAMGLRILRLDGQPCELLDYIIRWAFRVVDFYLTAGSAALLLVGFSATRQRIGDLLSNTVVVKYFPRENTIEQLLKIRSLGNYTPTYPESSRISEAEAILIKEVIDRYRFDRSPGHKKALSETCQWMVKKMGLPSRPVADKNEFLISVLRDYVALSR